LSGGSPSIFSRVGSALRSLIPNNLGDFSSEPTQEVFPVPVDNRIKIDVRAHCDKEYGGGSESCYSIMEDETEGTYLNWKGKLEFTEEHKVATKAAAGYAALKVNYNSHIDLLDYVGFLVKVRSRTTATLVFNMKTKSIINDDMYQGTMQLVGDNQWHTAYTPFIALNLTSNGRMKEANRKNDYIQLEGLGLLMVEDGKLENLFVEAPCKSSFIIVRSYTDAFGD
jgi:hypothetical protein